MMNKEYDYELIFDDEGQVELDYEEQIVRLIDNEACKSYTYQVTANHLRKLKNKLKSFEFNSFAVIFNSLQREFAV